MTLTHERLSDRANRIAGVLASLDSPRVAEHTVSRLSFLAGVREALATARDSGRSAFVPAPQS